MFSSYQPAPFVFSIGFPVEKAIPFYQKNSDNGEQIPDAPHEPSTFKWSRSFILLPDYGLIPLGKSSACHDNKLYPASANHHSISGRFPSVCGDAPQFRNFL